MFQILPQALAQPTLQPARRVTQPSGGWRALVTPFASHEGRWPTSLAIPRTESATKQASVAPDAATHTTAAATLDRPTISRDQNPKSGPLRRRGPFTQMTVSSTPVEKQIQQLVGDYSALGGARQNSGYTPLVLSPFWPFGRQPRTPVIPNRSTQHPKRGVRRNDPKLATSKS